MRREAGGIGTAGASRTGRRNRNSRGEPDGPEEPGQVGQAGQEIPKRAEQAGTGRNRKKPGAENRSGLNRYRQAWLQQLFGQRPYAGCIIAPQAASFLNRPHPCPRPRASGSSRVHHRSTGRIFLNRPHPCTPAARFGLQPGASRTAEHHTVKPSNTTPTHCQTAVHRRVRRRSPLTLVARGRGTGVLLEVLAEEGLR